MSVFTVCDFCGREITDSNFVSRFVDGELRVVHERCWRTHIDATSRTRQRERHLKYKNAWYDEELRKEAQRCI